MQGMVLMPPVSSYMSISGGAGGPPSYVMGMPMGGMMAATSQRGFPSHGYAAYGASNAAAAAASCSLAKLQQLTNGIMDIAPGSPGQSAAAAAAAAAACAMTPPSSAPSPSAAAAAAHAARSAAQHYVPADTGASTSSSASAKYVAAAAAAGSHRYQRHQPTLNPNLVGYQGLNGYRQAPPSGAYFQQAPPAMQMMNMQPQYQDQSAAQTTMYPYTYLGGNLPSQTLNSMMRR